jgi:hypothetical protein
VSVPPQPAGTDGGWESSSWVGLNGDSASGTQDILQTGIRQSVNAAGTPKYVAWYEWFANGDTTPPYVFESDLLNITPKAGDTIFGQVYFANGMGTAFIWDKSIAPLNNPTSANSFAVTLSPPVGATVPGRSAEWIMEAPDSAEPGTSLPAFTPVTFSQTQVTDTQGAVFGATDIPGSNEDISVLQTIAFGGTQEVLLTSTTAQNNQVVITFVGNNPN